MACSTNPKSLAVLCSTREISATLGREDLSLICNGGEISYDVGTGEKVTFVYESPFANSMTSEKVRHAFAKCGLYPITIASTEHRSMTDDLDGSVTEDVLPSTQWLLLPPKPQALT
jgi:hypothetical protein